MTWIYDLMFLSFAAEVHNSFLQFLNSNVAEQKEDYQID